MRRGVRAETETGASVVPAPLCGQHGQLQRPARTPTGPPAPPSGVHEAECSPPPLSPQSSPDRGSPRRRSHGPSPRALTHRAASRPAPHSAPPASVGTPGMLFLREAGPLSSVTYLPGLRGVRSHSLGAAPGLGWPLPAHCGSGELS